MLPPAPLPLVRIQKPSAGPNGYYLRTNANGDTPYERYLYDRRLLAGEPGDEKPLRGRKAEKKVKGRFGDTSISHLGYFRPGSNAGKCYTDLKASDKLPKAVKPKKKTRNVATAPTRIRSSGCSEERSSWFRRTS